VKNVTGVLQALPGVQDVQVSLGTASATVRHDPAQTSVEALRAAVEDAGFDSPA
jgi:copper chaperone